jgi:single-strand DNA-binding protein
MNKAILIGRLTKDPEIRYSQGENATAIAQFTLAVDRKFKKAGEQEADFIGCKAFGKPAEFVVKYFKQGMKMVLVGHIQTGSYTNKDGVKVYTTDIIADEIEFAESKGNGGNSSNSNTKPQGTINEGFTDLGNVDSDSLPFN